VESLGEKLKAARALKGCTFDQVSRDTNIARRYLEALEAEAFDQFPGEPYLLGFLRNYAEYLGLEAQELITAYRTLKIQDQPIPVEQLLQPMSPPPYVGVAVGAAVVVVVGLAIGGVLYLKGSAAKAVPATVARQAQELALESGSLEKRLFLNDAVVAKVGAESYRLTVDKLGETVALGTPAGALSLELGQETAIDLTGDGVSDLSVFVADLYKGQPDKGAVLRLSLTAGEAVPAAAAAPAAAGTAAAAAPESAAAPASISLGAPVVFNSVNPYPFTLQATFKGYCLFRWEADRADREERYFHKAEILNVQAQNGIRLWVSNASAVKLVVIGGGKTVDLEIGGSGEVVVTDLKWVKDEDGRFKLTTVRLD
jgi:cytoskeletal protein RodZ